MNKFKTLKYLVFFKIIFVTLFLMGCDSFTELTNSETKNLMSTSSSTEKPIQEVFSVPEPMISNIENEKPPFNAITSTLKGDTDREIPLKGLMSMMENATFHINDSITFMETENYDTQQVEFKIYSECMEGTNQKQFRKEMKIPYKDQINLIEMIPEEIFSYGKQWWSNQNIKNPSCSFRFHAQNDEGDIHYFELPHLIIDSFENSFHMSIIENNPALKGRKAFSPELTQQFPILNFDQLRERDYSIITNYEDEIDEIKLICQSFQLSFSVSNNHYYDLWKLPGWGSIPKENQFNQACRLISSYQNQTRGISQLFPLVFPTKNLFVRIISHQKTNQYSPSGIQDVTSLINDFKNKKKFRTYHNVASLEIRNKNPNSVHLLIPEIEFEADYSLIFGNNDFYTAIDAQLSQYGYFLHLENAADITLQNSALSQETPTVTTGLISWKNDQALIEIPAQSSVHIPISIQLNRGDCKNHNYMGMGIVIEGQNPTIYQVLNSSDFSKAQNSIIDQIDWSKQNEQKEHPFFLEFYHYQADFNKAHYFYENTCPAMQVGKLNEVTAIKSTFSWRATAKQDSIKFKRSLQTMERMIDDRFKEKRQQLSQNK